MQTPELAAFAKRIDELVRIFGSRRELARRIKVSESTVREWLKGENLPTTTKADAAAARLGISSAQFLGRDQLPPEFAQRSAPKPLFSAPEEPERKVANAQIIIQIIRQLHELQQQQQEIQRRQIDAIDRLIDLIEMSATTGE